MTGSEAGDLVTIAFQGNYGKRHPALIIRADQFADLMLIVIVSFTSTLIEALLLHLTIEPSAGNELRALS